MTSPEVFRIANSTALLSWVVLVVAGRLRYVATLVTGVIVPLLLAVAYVAILASHWGEGSGNFNSLEGVAQLFANPWVLLGGWIHYLAFDLFIGSWQVRDASVHRIPHLLVIPCLILTFLFGPAGLLLYFLLRTAKLRRVTIDVPAAPPVVSRP